MHHHFAIIHGAPQRGACGDNGATSAYPIFPETVSRAPMKTRFILIDTSHAGNVGACARAMKVMGFGDLVLVAPRWANVLRREETIQRASGALDVLQNARIVATLDEALHGMTHLCATAMTPRDFGPPTMTPREYFEMLLKQELTEKAEKGLAAENIMNPGAGMAFLFGSERFGMRNEDVYRCHVCLCIPTNPSFGSLNLGAAIQVIAYEWRLALGGFAVQPSAGVPAHADAQQVSGMLAHWQQVLVQIGFLDPQAPKKLMPRLNQLANRAHLTVEEIHILRGIAKAVAQVAARAKGHADAPAGAPQPAKIPVRR
jgi:tRNA/rRNA methyltransferase